MEPIAPLMMADWFSFFDNPATLVFMIPITAILVGGIIGISKRIMRHRERMAMIERGMDPDRAVDPGE
ncbi:MAG: hypothetical protein ABSG53_27345 [Thermoguttaceae bacterium]|jgi:hypothetical protein